MSKKKGKGGKFPLRRVSGEILKSEKKEEVKRVIHPKVKEVVKAEKKKTEIRKAIVPVQEEIVEEDIKDHGLSNEEMGLLENVESILKKQKESLVEEVVGHRTEHVHGGLTFGGVEDVENTSIRKIDGWSFPELKRNEIIELTPDSRYNIFETVVSRVKNFKAESFTRISNGSKQSELFGKAIGGVYLKEIKYQLKNVPYLHVRRNKEIFEINLCSEIISINDYAYFVIVEVSKENKTEEVQKIILIDTNFILK